MVPQLTGKRAVVTGGAGAFLASTRDIAINGDAIAAAAASADQSATGPARLRR